MLELIPIDIKPTYTKLKIEGKERRVRFFGPIRIIKSNGRELVLRPEGYMFIKNEPATRYTYTKDVINYKELKRGGKQNG